MNEWEYRVRIFRWGMVIPCSDMQTAGHLPLVMTTKDDTTDWKTFVCKKNLTMPMIGSALLLKILDKVKNFKFLLASTFTVLHYCTPRNSLPIDNYFVLRAKCYITYLLF